MMHAISVTYYLNDDDLENILITALEGGIGYWAVLDNSNFGDHGDLSTSEYAWKILYDLGELHFFDAEDEDEEYSLTLADFFNGIGKAIQNGYWDCDMDTLDASIADVIMQYAMVGSVVYS